MSLILPEKFVKEHKQGLVDEFNKSLEKVINDNQHRDQPYFVSYHDNDDKRLPGVIRAKWSVSDDLPIRWARQIVYWVDNKKGFKEWLWTCDDDRTMHVNRDGVLKARKAGAIVPKKQ